MILDVGDYHVSRTRTKLGDRAFSIAGPKAWNNFLPQLVRSADSLDSFKRKLKFYFLTHVLMFELFMYVYSYCNALSARFFAVDRALNSYFTIMIMINGFMYLCS